MKRCFSLPPRLQTVADLVPQGQPLADIGTDHGRLPAWLLLHDRIPCAVATDLRPGPLSKAQELAKRWALEDKLSFRLCDGLTALSPKEAETIVIAGMGGETIAEIMAAVSWAREPGHCYILQAMSGMDGLRRYLSVANFRIVKEILVEDGNTLYVVLYVEPGGGKKLTEGEIWAGQQSRDDPLRGRYLEQELFKLQRAVAGLEQSRRPDDKEKKKWYELAAWEVAQMKKEWDSWQP